MAKNSSFYSLGNINKKIVILLAIILVAIGAVVTTVVVKKNNSKNEEVLSSDSLKDVSDNIVSNNDKKENENDTNTENEVLNNETKNTAENEQLQFSNNNETNNINTNNQNANFIQKGLNTRLRIGNSALASSNLFIIEKVSIIIGQNDSGKTNICSAIMKVLDYNKRRIPFILTDSTTVSIPG